MCSEYVENELQRKWIAIIILVLFILFLFCFLLPFCGEIKLCVIIRNRVLARCLVTWLVILVNRNKSNQCMDSVTVYVLLFSNNLKKIMMPENSLVKCTSGIYLCSEWIERRRKEKENGGLREIYGRLIDYSTGIIRTHLGMQAMHGCGQYTGWSDVTESVVTIRSPFCGYNTI